MGVKRDAPQGQHDSASPEVAFAQSDLGQRLLRCLSDGSAARRRIADYLLRNQMRMTALGIEELAESCQVSSATISRFARDIGFKNYAALRTEVAATLQSMLLPVDKLRNQIGRRARAATPASESLVVAADNIGAAGLALDAAVVAQVVAKLTRAGTVYVMGFGLSFHLAGQLALHLQPFCRHVIEVAGHGGTEVAAGHLANITAGDVLVAIALPRYALDAIRLAGFARSRDATVVSITDSPASPLAELGSLVLYAQGNHPVLASSSSAALAVIEALAVSLMVSNKANVAKAARLTEAISSYLYDTTNSSSPVSISKPKRRSS
jgi:DNA-binding MurR/RpiR family transcriptional regulator